MDELSERCIILLNIVRVKMLARVRMLDLVQDNKEHLRDDLDRFTRAKDHVEASLSFLNQTHFAPDEVQLELPWDDD